jgi:hypothetical protein
LALSTLSEKVNYIKEHRAENYRHSLRLEGVEQTKTSKPIKLSKEEVIAKYKALAS